MAGRGRAQRPDLGLGEFQLVLEAPADFVFALELLQTYFLVQDDWMDEADTRRGAPSVHVTLAEQRK